MKFMQTVDYKYIIKRRASRKIFTFYSNVAKKYRHTYDKEDLKRDVQNAVFSIYMIIQKKSSFPPSP